MYLVQLCCPLHCLVSCHPCSRDLLTQLCDLHFCGGCTGVGLCCCLGGLGQRRRVRGLRGLGVTGSLGGGGRRGRQLSIQAPLQWPGCRAVIIRSVSKQVPTGVSLM
jgi:hypothetical protein